ncbi:hypothetical protein VaNZ11_003481, partial [Volvox africanus]
RPAPPLGYDFDLDGAAETDPAAMQNGALGPAPGHGRMINNDSGNGPGPSAVLEFDYLLDEPTPPPKQLPKGTRLLRPGQRAPPPPQQSALPLPLPKLPPQLQQPQPQPQSSTGGSFQVHGGEQGQRPHQPFYDKSNYQQQPYLQQFRHPQAQHYPQMQLQQIFPQQQQQQHNTGEHENPQCHKLQQQEATALWEVVEPGDAHRRAHGATGEGHSISWEGNPEHLPQLLNTMPQHIFPEQNSAAPVGLQRGQLLCAHSSDESICHRHAHSGIGAGQSPWQPLRPQPQQGAATNQGIWKHPDQLRLQQQ